MSKDTNEEYAQSALKKFFDTATENITMSATLNRALADKISTETINTKVNNQFNSIQVSIYKINPKFNEKSKHYDIIKKEILDVLTDYEATLIEYSNYFDAQIEELLLKRVELESHLIGKIFKEENLKSVENKKEKEKETDKLKNTLVEKNKKFFEIFSNRKKENDLNAQDIRKLEDSLDLEQEQSKKLNRIVEKIQEKNKTNMSEIAGVEKDLSNVNKQIRELQESKKLLLEEAMETKDKWISKTIKKPFSFSRITIFFSCKFNTPKMVTKTIIDPLRIRISDFKTNGKNGVRKGEDYMKNYFISRYGAIKEIDFSEIVKKLIDNAVKKTNE